MPKNVEAFENLIEINSLHLNKNCEIVLASIFRLWNDVVGSSLAPLGIARWSAMNKPEAQVVFLSVFVNLALD